MRVFDQPNVSNDWNCPVCKKNEDKMVVLIGIYGTQGDNIMEAEQFHLDCLSELIYNKDAGVIYQRVV